MEWFYYSFRNKPQQLGGGGVVVVAKESRMLPSAAEMSDELELKYDYSALTRLVTLTTHRCRCSCLCRVDEATNERDLK